MKILIAGDLVINQTYDTSKLNRSIIELFKSSDINIVNLEAPVTSSISKIIKTGPHLKSEEKSTLNVLRALNIHVVTLANNHVLDYDAQGVKDTLEFCEKNNFKAVGAGANLEEASKTLYLETTEGRVAIVNFAENEWASATSKTAGANPMDLIDNLNQIREAKKVANYVLVIIHGGNEYNHYPSPRMVKQYRFYAENGADLVVGHHTHCVGGYEIHKGVPIFYSLGNFLFMTKLNKTESWYSGLVLNLNLQKGKKIDFELIPVSQSKNEHILYIAQGEDKDKVHNLIERINFTISDEKLLEVQWSGFVKKSQEGFIKAISPIGAVKNKYIKGILRRFKLHKLFLNKTYVKEHFNRIRCEAHYDVAKEFFTNYMKK